MRRSLNSREYANGLGGRAVGTVAAEAFSSVQNFVILFAGLHYLSLNGIGEFALAYTVALLIETILRSLLLEPLSIRFSAASTVDQRRAGAQAFGSCLVIGTLSAIPVALGALALQGPARDITLAAALMVPSLIGQEAWRVYFFTTARPWRAAANDACCLVVTLGLMVFLVVRQHTASPAALLLIWTGGTGFGVFFGLLQSRLRPDLGRGLGWARDHWQLGSRLAGGTGVEQIAGRVSLTLIGAIAGSVALGTFAAARTLLAPITTVIVASLTFSVPEAVRLRRRCDPRLHQFIGGVAVVLTGLVVLFGIAMYLAPDGLGRIIAGRNWQAAKTLLLPALISTATIAARQAPRTGLRVFVKPGAIVRLSALTGGAVILGSAAGAAIFGAAGAAWGFALAQLTTSLAWWLTYRRVARTAPTGRQRVPDT